MAGLPWRGGSPAPVCLRLDPSTPDWFRVEGLGFRVSGCEEGAPKCWLSALQERSMGPLGMIGIHVDDFLVAGSDP